MGLSDEPMSSPPSASQAELAAAFDAILKSETFSKAYAIRSVLRYLWDHRDSAVDEYSIAVHALSRRPDFDPKMDSAVRVSMSRLRSKLKEFYDSEGRDCGLLLWIPRHGFELEYQLTNRSQPAGVALPASPSARRAFLLPLLTADLTAAISGRYNFNSRLTANPQSLAGTGSGLASFALGSVATASIDSNIGVSYPSLSYAAFIQDDIKLTRNFTVNLGLRYDYQQIPRERHNGISVFNATSVNPLNNLPGRLDFAGQDFHGAPIDPDRNDFGPRAGFAWDFLGNGSTVLRGGYGIYYPFIFPITAGGNGYPSLGFTNNFTNYNPPGNNVDLPAFQLRGGLPTPPIPPLGSAVGPNAFYSQNVSSIQRNDRTPYSQQFTLSLQRQLRGGYLLESSYSGNKGTKLVGASYDYNQLDPRFLSLGSSLLDNVPNPYAGRVTGSFGGASIQRRQLMRPLPYYGNISITNPHDASSIYHSFLLNLEKRFSKGLVFLASYTFGKSISDGVTARAGVAEQINVGDFQSGRYNRAVERAIDPTDSASRFVTSGIYELPFGPTKPFNSSIGFVNRIIEVWQVNGVLVLQSGFPLVIRGANNNAANRPDSTGVSASLPSGEQSVRQWFRTDVFVNPAPFTFGNVGRTLPDVRGPGTTNIDFSLIKNTRLTEKFRLQFRAEAFNALNTANYRLPNTTFTPDAQGRNANPNFGVITAARDARIVQLGLKLLF